MSQPIGKVSLDLLESFLKARAEEWEVDDSDLRGFDEYLPSHRPVSIAELMLAFQCANHDEDHVFLYNTSELTPYEAANEADLENIPSIGQSELDDFIVAGMGSDFLYVAPSMEDASNGSYVNLMPVEKAEEDSFEELVPPGKVRPLIRRVSIENFKGIGHRFEFELKPITLFFGPNSAGKSSIIHALLYAREIVERRNADADRTLGGGTFVDLGGFASFVHGRDRSHPVCLRFDLDLKGNGLPQFGVALRGPNSGPVPVVDFGDRVESASIEMVIVWSYVNCAPYIAKYSLDLNGQPFAQIEADIEVSECELSFLATEHPILDSSYERSKEAPTEYDIEPRKWIAELFEISDGSINPVLINGERDALPAAGSTLRLTYPRLESKESKLFQEWAEFDYQADILTTLLTQLIVGPLDLLRSELTNFRYLGPLREPPPRHYVPPRSPDPSRWPSGLAAWDLLTREPDLVDQASLWLSSEDRLDAGYGLELFEYKELPLSSRAYIQIASTPDIDDLDMIREEIEALDTKRRLVLVTPQLRILPPDVGVGISQLVPVLGLALDPQTGVAAIEQPELHLHPRLQAELGDLFIESSRDAGRCFLLETHSEHLILRIQRRIRETVEGRPHRGVAVTPNDVAIYYSNPRSQGEPVRRIDLDSRGEFIQPWPDDFFEIDFYERFTR